MTRKLISVYFVITLLRMGEKSLLSPQEVGVPCDILCVLSTWQIRPLFSL